MTKVTLRHRDSSYDAEDLVHVSVQETVEGEEGLYRPGVPTRRRSCLKLQTARRICKASPLPPAPSVTVDRLTTDMDVC